MTATSRDTAERSNGVTWQRPPPTPQPEPASGGAAAVRHPGATHHRPDPTPVQGQLDADLSKAVRQVTWMRQGFYVVVLLVALGGQVTGAIQTLHIPAIVAVPALAALELGGIVVMANADVRRRLGERAVASRILSAGIAAGAVTFNWLAHPDHLLGGFYSGMSALGYAVWLMHSENQRRDRLRATGDLAPTTPAYELIGHWLRHPIITRRARSMAKANPALGLYDSLEAARAELRRERRDAAIARVLHRKIRAAVDPTTAEIAVRIYDLNEIAKRLADHADYDGLTALIAADLAPGRIAAHPDPGTRGNRRRPFRRRPAPTTQSSPVVGNDPTVQAAGLAEAVVPIAPQQDVTPCQEGTAREGDPHDEQTEHPPPDVPAPPVPVADPPATPHVQEEPEPVPPAPQPAPGGAAPPTEQSPPESAGDSANGKPVAEPGPEPRTEAEIPSETAAAVAYWLSQDPHLDFDVIARNIGRSARTVRRNLPPGFQRPPLA